MEPSLGVFFLDDHQALCNSASEVTAVICGFWEMLQMCSRLRDWHLHFRLTVVCTCTIFQPSLGVKKPTKALLFVILSPVGPYFSTGSFNPVSLWANPKYVRAWKGGTGDCKMGGNYGSSLFAQCEAVENACQQVLWLYGEDNQITEVGTMNLFLYWINEDGGNPLRFQLSAIFQSFSVGLERKELKP